MSKGKITAEELSASAWAAALADTVVPDTIPPGWLTSSEIGAMLDRSHSTVTRHISAAVAQGKCEMKKFRIASGQRGVHPILHYRLKK